MSIGHNNPPPFDAGRLDALKTTATEFAAVAKDWAKTEITEENAGRANDFLTGGRRLIKQIEEARKADKEPYIEAGKAVDAAYKPLVTVLETALDGVKAALTAFAKIKAEAEAAAARKAAEEARIAAEMAEAERKAAEEAGDEIAAEEARMAAEEARKAEQLAASAKSTGAVESATGMGRTAALRTYYTAEIVDPIKAITWAFRENPAEMRALVVRMAEARKRHDKTTEIPGIKFNADQRIA